MLTKNKILIVFLCLLGLSVQAQVVDLKNIDYGIGYFEFNSASPNSAIKNTLSNVVRKELGLNVQGAKIKKNSSGAMSNAVFKVFSYNKLSDKRYLVYGYFEDDIDTIKRITPAQYYSDSFAYDLWGNQLTKAQNILLASVDLESKKVTRIWADDKKTLNSLNLSYGGRYSTGSVEAYGCLQGYPLVTLDINNDEEKELLFLGGGGALYLPDEEVSAYTHLSIFSGENFENNMLTIDIHEEKFLFNFDESGDVYQVVRDQVGQRLKGGEYDQQFVVGTEKNLRPGYRNFSKVFFGDFDEDGIYSLLVWNREYLSGLKSNVSDGFKLASEDFDIHHINGKKVVSSDFSRDDAMLVLDKYNLDWNKGFPNMNKCYGNSNTSKSVFLNYNHGKLLIPEQ